LSGDLVEPDRGAPAVGRRFLFFRGGIIFLRDFDAVVLEVTSLEAFVALVRSQDGTVARNMRLTGFLGLFLLVADGAEHFESS